jgi:GAF domain-containing protein
MGYRDAHGHVAQSGRRASTLGHVMAHSNMSDRVESVRLAEEQAALRRVATLAARESSPLEVFEAVAEEAARVLEVDAIGLLRFEPDETATLVAQSETPWDPPPLGTRFTLEGENIIASVHRTGEAARMDDWESATGSVAAMANVLGVRSTVASPIVVEGRLWGTMIAATNQSEPLPAETESRIVAFTELLATSIANAESREALSRLATEQAALRRVATLVAQDVRPSEIFAAVAEEVADLFHTTGSVLRFEEGGQAAVVVGIAKVDIPLGLRMEFEEGMGPIEVYRTGRPVRIDHTTVDHSNWSSEEGSVISSAGHLGLVSSVVSPIVVEGRTWGVIGVSSTDDPLPLDTEERLGKFTELVATAIANAESRENLSRLAQEQAALRRVATLVAREPSQAEVFGAINEEIGRLIGAQAVRMLRYERDEGAVVVASWGEDGDVFPQVGFRAKLGGDNATTRVFLTGQPVRIDNYEEASGPIGEAVRAASPLRSYVATPIIVEGRTWGVVIAGTSRSEPMPQDTESRLTQFSELLATAIANAESRGALAELADEQAALRRVATLVAGQAAPDEIYAAVAEEVARLLLADRCAVVRYEPDDTLTVTAYWSTDGTDVPVGTRIPLEGDVVTATVRQSGRPIRINTFDGLSGPLVDHARTVGPEPRSSVGAPIFVEGQAWGTIFIASMKTDFPDDAESRVMLFTELVATAIANAENRAELAASRKRLVAASDEARRRIERDLHDGTQQRLVSLALAARAAAAELPPGNGEVRDNFAQIATGLGEALEDLQELSRGIHPAILSDAGLGPALETLALRSPIPVELEVRTQERFTEPVEVAAYFVASESLANAAKHSQASRINILLVFENERLRLSVRDDGIGGADPGRGSGLVGLRDRVEALGGTLAIESVSGAGTSLSAALPVADDPGDPAT